MLLIPAIDLRAGRCVRLYQGDFAAETLYPADPRGLVSRYRERGATWLHVVDLDGARDGVAGNRELIAELATAATAGSSRAGATALRLQVGGGVRTASAIEDLLDAGVARVVVGSAALERTNEVVAWLERFGAERIVLAFDVRMQAVGPRVRTHGWTADTDMGLWDAVGRYAMTGLRHVLCTDIARDGTFLGPNLELYRSALERFPHLLWQASGGVSNAADLGALRRTGVAAAVCGKALLVGRIQHEELRPFWPDASSPAST
jgi:phosphoribosylformimino-5-aminoimidazole carboxamide ribotide isomerase